MPRKAKAKEAEKENGERWLVTYSDLITLLLVFFIILYASSNQDTAKMAETLSAIAGAFTGTEFVLEGNGSDLLETFSGESLAMMEAQSMQAVKESIEQMTELAGLGDDAIEVSIDSGGVHIRIKDTVLFASGSADINATALPILDKIGEALKQLPNNYIQIEGHTDNVPMGGNIKHLETNWELGSLRAVTVLRTLVKNCALNPKYLSAVSYGEFQPIESNNTAEGRAKNRRVEINILRNYSVDE